MSRTLDKAVKRTASAGLRAVERSSSPPPPRAVLSPILLHGAITGLAAADAALEEPIVWSWADWFTAGSAVEVFGKSTSGKTTLAALIVAAMCAPPDEPVELFGRKVAPMPEGKLALVVFDENSKPSAVRKLDLAIEALGIDRAYAWSRVLLFARSGLHAAAYSGDVDALVAPEPNDRWGHVMHAALYQEAFGLIVLDTRARIFGPLGSSNDEESQALVADTIACLTKAGAPVLVLSHPRKGGGNDLDDMSGSAQRAAGTDSAISVAGIKRGGQTIASTVTLQKSRDEPDEWPTAVEFVLRRKKDGSSEFTWTTGRDRPQANKPDRCAQVLEALSAGPMNQTELKTALRISGATANSVLIALEAEKRITKEKKGPKSFVYAIDPSWKELFSGEE